MRHAPWTRSCTTPSEIWAYKDSRSGAVVVLSISYDSSWPLTWDHQWKQTQMALTFDLHAGEWQVDKWYCDPHLAQHKHKHLGRKVSQRQIQNDFSRIRIGWHGHVGVFTVLVLIIVGCNGPIEHFMNEETWVLQASGTVEHNERNHGQHVQAVLQCVLQSQVFPCAGAWVLHEWNFHIVCKTLEKLPYRRPPSVCDLMWTVLKSICIRGVPFMLLRVSTNMLPDGVRSRASVVELGAFLTSWWQWWIWWDLRSDSLGFGSRDPWSRSSVATNLKNHYLQQPMTNHS